MLHLMLQDSALVKINSFVLLDLLNHSNVKCSAFLAKVLKWHFLDKKKILKNQIYNDQFQF